MTQIRIKQMSVIKEENVCDRNVIYFIPVDLMQISK